MTMHTPFTIGLLGGCGDGLRTARYFEHVVAYHRKTFPRVRVLLPLMSKGQRSVAAHLMACRQDDPGLEIGVALTARQWENYLNGAANGRLAECNRIIDAADYRGPVPDSRAQLSRPALFRLFIEQCDHIVFNEHRAGMVETGMFAAQVVDMGVPMPVQYGLTAPEVVSTTYPLNRLEYLDPAGGYYDPEAEIGQSVAYIRQNGFSVRADRVPLIFIRKWLAAIPLNSYRHLTTPDDIADLSRLKDRPGHDYLSLKVFAFAYAARRTKQDMIGDDAIRCFRQFRDLLETVAERRDAGKRVEPFDLLDFDRYA